ncbi:MAG: aldehyde dehydrogenase [Anaerovoracaceae bacterium]
MDAAVIRKMVKESREYFMTGETLKVSTRIAALRRLKASIISHEEEINDALKKDLGKSRAEGYMCEIGMTLSEITYMIRNVRSFAKCKRVMTPLAQFHATSYTLPSPHGVVLIMSPWNYPFMLAMEPLVDAIAAGNTAVIKPSAYSPATSEIIGRIISECFDERYVSVVTGGRAENQALLKEHFDYIFFTGSKSVGKEVMRNAAEYLTPVTLELGGKSPCIVDSSANIELAARRIVFGKYLNCGQTCVAPDYIMCHSSVKDRFLKAVKAEISRQYGDSPLDNPHYGKIINEKHFDRICALIDHRKVIIGGGSCRDTLMIEPTVMADVTAEDAVMKEEIFGPIMPVLTFNNLDDVIHGINSGDSPLSLYMFSQDKKAVKRVTESCGFGGGCVNDTIIHLATSEMGFGGFGASGMGSYHGKAGFETFSHRKSIVDKKCWIDLPMRYQPYKKLNEKLIRMFMK